MSHGPELQVLNSVAPGHNDHFLPYDLASSGKGFFHVPPFSKIWLLASAERALPVMAFHLWNMFLREPHFALPSDASRKICKTALFCVPFINELCVHELCCCWLCSWFRFTGVFLWLHFSQYGLWELLQFVLLVNPKEWWWWWWLCDAYVSWSVYHWTQTDIYSSKHECNCNVKFIQKGALLDFLSEYLCIELCCLSGIFLQVNMHRMLQSSFVIL